MRLWKCLPGVFRKKDFNELWNFAHGETLYLLSGMSALSIEEQRLLQSLERLNERLKGKLCSIFLPISVVRFLFGVLVYFLR